MGDFDRALADIDHIRGQIARAAEFRGYGPATLAATALLALAAAVFQCYWPAADFIAYVTLWSMTALAAVALVCTEMILRTRRFHRGLAGQMIGVAAEQFLPVGVAGALLTLVLYRAAPQSLGLIPGLWQILFSLGIFASCRFLPRPAFAVGLWYLAAGLTCLAYGLGLSPWAMGIPFAIGQLLLAAVMFFARGLR